VFINVVLVAVVVPLAVAVVVVMVAVAVVAAAVLQILVFLKKVLHARGTISLSGYVDDYHIT